MRELLAEKTEKISFFQEGNSKQSAAKDVDCSRSAVRNLENVQTK